MCGISAIYGFDSDKDNRKKTLVKMLSVVKHRGPDGWGYYLSPDIALGQNRLSIVDLKTGDQPMVTKENVIVFNGEEHLKTILLNILDGSILRTLR